MKSTWELLENRVIYYEHVIKSLLQSLDIPIDRLHFVRGTTFQLSRFAFRLYFLIFLESTHLISFGFADRSPKEMHSKPELKSWNKSVLCIFNQKFVLGRIATAFGTLIPSFASTRWAIFESWWTVWRCRSTENFYFGWRTVTQVEVREKMASNEPYGSRINRRKNEQVNLVFLLYIVVFKLWRRFKNWSPRQPWHCIPENYECVLS